jgi:hypothetical protein
MAAGGGVLREVMDACARRIPVEYLTPGGLLLALRVEPLLRLRP